MQVRRGGHAWAEARGACAALADAAARHGLLGLQCWYAAVPWRRDGLPHYPPPNLPPLPPTTPLPHSCRFVVLADALGLTASVGPVPGLAPVAVVDVLAAMVDEIEAAVWAAAVVQMP